MPNPDKNGISIIWLNYKDGAPFKFVSPPSRQEILERDIHKNL